MIQCPVKIKVTILFSDSVFWLSKGTDPAPLLTSSHHLGEMKSELGDDEHISEMVIGGERWQYFSARPTRLTLKHHLLQDRKHTGIGSATRSSNISIRS